MHILFSSSDMRKKIKIQDIVVGYKYKKVGYCILNYSLHVLAVQAVIRDSLKIILCITLVS